MDKNKLKYIGQSYLYSSAVKSIDKIDAWKFLATLDDKISFAELLTGLSQEDKIKLRNVYSQIYYDNVYLRLGMLFTNMENVIPEMIEASKYDRKDIPVEFDRSLNVRNFLQVSKYLPIDNDVANVIAGFL